MRNSCFIRNYCLKRSKSRLFFQKDGEVVVKGDFIKSCINWKDYNPNSAWRPGLISVLDEPQTDYFIKNNTIPFKRGDIKRLNGKYPKSANEARDIIFNAHGSVNFSTYFQYAFCADTKVMQEMCGYDEDYYYYGYEDSDMFCRLFSAGYKMNYDYSCHAIHQCHPRSLSGDEVNNMEDIFKNKDMDNVNRNPDGWGKGK